MANDERHHEVPNPQWLIWRSILYLVMAASLIAIVTQAFRSSASLSLSHLDVAGPSDTMFLCGVIGFVGSLVGLAITTPPTIRR